MSNSCYVFPSVIFQAVHAPEGPFQRARHYLNFPKFDHIISTLHYLELAPLVARNHDRQLSEFWDWVQENRTKKVVPITDDTILRATELSIDYNLPRWESLHVAAALAAEADYFLTPHEESHAVFKVPGVIFLSTAKGEPPA
ncbi:MAG: hypothetical protein RLY93_03905 [Sumerlaeia bacterium]